MCNRYGNHISFQQYVESLQKAKIPLVSPSGDRAPNLEPRDNIFPTDIAPILRTIEGGLELAQCRWGLIPGYYKGTVKEWKILTTNARADNLQTSKVYRSAYQKRRCLVPLDQFYEWTGEKSHKTKWSFSRRDKDWFCFAGLWDKAQTKDELVESFTLITTDAGPDIEPYHHRQPVIIERDDYQRWLSGPDAEALLVPSPTGVIAVSEAPTERGLRSGKSNSLPAHY